MLANSELLVMLNQAATDREELAKLLNISETSCRSIKRACGRWSHLLKRAIILIPGEQIWENTKLYQLMTTKPNESSNDGKK